MDSGAKRDDRWGRIYRRRQSEYVTELPSLLDYFSFIYHYPGILGGPNTYYREFIDVTNNTRYPYGCIPLARWKWAALNFLKGLTFFGIFVVASLLFPPDAIVADDFKSRSLLLRMLICYLTYLGVRFRYFGLWKLGESLCICGGYGELEDKTWNGISNVDIWEFETSCSMSVATREWNKRTQRWLQMCIYERSNFNQLYVFLVSAFWHGFYPSYYFCFLTGSLLQALNKSTTAKLWPRVQGTKWEWLYLRLGNVGVMLVGSFMLAAMFSYSFEKAWKVWTNLSFYGLWILGVGFVVMWMVPKVKKE